VSDTSLSETSQESLIVQAAPQQAGPNEQAKQAERAKPAIASLLRLHTPREWSLIGLCILIAVIVIPVLNLLPADAALHFPDYLIPLLGKFVCYALVALAVDLIWGYAGILSLGHGVFFALGGYAMGMYLMRTIGTEGVYRSALPDFMVFLDWQALPWYWYGFSNFGFALLMAMLVPGVLAYVFGFFAFRRRRPPAVFCPDLVILLFQDFPRRAAPGKI